MMLEQVLANWREDAAVLRRRGHPHDAELIERLCDEVAASAEDFLRWLTESEAALRAGRSPKWLQRQFAGWVALGLARHDGRRRLYRMVIIPQRAQPSLAHEAGRAAARGAA